MQNITFKVDDGLNTSYIDSLLIALFYKSSDIQTMLTSIPENASFMYLQDLIQRNFIDLIRQNYSIDSSIINEIRNYSIICGWKPGPTITNLATISNYYVFLASNFNIGLLNFELTNSFSSQIETISNTIINISPTKSSSTKELLHDWINAQLLKINNEGNPTSHYHFKEIPQIVAFSINRTSNSQNINIDIMKKIKFSGNNNDHQNNLTWSIHSIICFNTTSSSFYSIIKCDDNWYMFDNNNNPSFNKIDIIKNIYIQHKIKCESTFIIYCLNNSLSFAI